MAPALVAVFQEYKWTHCGMITLTDVRDLFQLWTACLKNTFFRQDVYLESSELFRSILDEKGIFVDSFALLSHHSSQTDVSSVLNRVKMVHVRVIFVLT